VAKPGAVLAAWGYGNIRINNVIDPVIHHFYSNIVGMYWDAARRHVETHYANLSFPFDTLTTPEFFIEGEWTINHLLGYLKSWSSTQSYIKAEGTDPVSAYAEMLRRAWGEKEKLPIRFPVFLKLGLIKK
jgi:hypothetical protein